MQIGLQYALMRGFTRKLNHKVFTGIDSSNVVQLRAVELADTMLSLDLIDYKILSRLSKGVYGSVNKHQSMSILLRLVVLYMQIDHVKAIKYMVKLQDHIIYNKATFSTQFDVIVFYAVYAWYCKRIKSKNHCLMCLNAVITNAEYFGDTCETVNGIRERANGILEEMYRSRSSDPTVALLRLVTREDFTSMLTVEQKYEVIRPAFHNTNYEGSFWFIHRQKCHRDILFAVIRTLYYSLEKPLCKVSYDSENRIDAFSVTRCINEFHMIYGDGRPRAMCSLNELDRIENRHKIIVFNRETLKFKKRRF